MGALIAREVHDGRAADEPDSANVHGEWTPRFAAGGGGGSAREGRRPRRRTAVNGGHETARSVAPATTQANRHSVPGISPPWMTPPHSMEHRRAPFTTPDPPARPPAPAAAPVRPPAQESSAQTRHIRPGQAAAGCPCAGGRTPARRAVTHATNRRRADVHAVSGSHPSTREGDCETEMFDARATVRPRPSVRGPPSHGPRPHARPPHPAAGSRAVVGQGRQPAWAHGGPANRRIDPPIAPPTPVRRQGHRRARPGDTSLVRPCAHRALPYRRATPPCRTATWRTAVTRAGGSPSAP